jgi:hypothetical protein
VDLQNTATHLLGATCSLFPGWPVPVSFCTHAYWRVSVQSPPLLPAFCCTKSDSSCGPFRRGSRWLAGIGASIRALSLKAPIFQTGEEQQQGYCCIRIISSQFRSARGPSLLTDWWRYPETFLTSVCCLCFLLCCLSRRWQQETELCLLGADPYRVTRLSERSEFFRCTCGAGNVCGCG